MNARIICALALLATVLGACEANERSLFVEYVEAPPKYPDCIAQGRSTPKGVLDLSFNNGYEAFVSVRNAMTPDADYRNGLPEPNGVIIDGAETYVRMSDGSVLGSTEYFEFEAIIDPSDSETLYGYLIPPSVARALMEQENCNELKYTNTAPTRTGPSENGLVYGVIRFLGHTNGNYEVETPEFSFPIELCCGCLVEWKPCYDPCLAYCDDAVVSTGSCIPGVGGDGVMYDCRLFYDQYDPNATWECGDDGVMCDCSTCE